MPFNFFKEHIYSINYNSLYNSPIISETFKNHPEYIESMIKILEEIDLTLNNTDINENFAPCNAFEQEVIFNVCTFYIQFNIDNILKNIFYHPLRYNHSKLYLKKTSIIDCISYTKESYERKHLQSKKPIILSPFYKLPAKKFVVIDGNHRLTAKLENNIEYINYIIYNPINKSDFCSLFDWAMYISFMEVNYIISKVNNGHSIETLLVGSLFFDIFQNFRFDSKESSTYSFTTD